MSVCRGCKKQLLNQMLLKFSNMPAGAQFFPTKKDLDKEKGVDIELFQCPNCGLVQAAGCPVPYYRDVIRATSVSNEMRIFRENQYMQWVNKYSLQNSRILEIGAGNGEYMTYMETTGALVFGLEHRTESVETARQAGHCMIEGFIENETMQVSEEPFDAFYSMNFLEHIPEPDEFLRGISANLKEGAVGLIEVPNFDMILEERLFSEFIQDHLSYFTKQAFVNLLEQNGFEVVTCEPIWHRYILSAEVKKRKQLDVSLLLQEQSTLKECVQSFLQNKTLENKRIAVWGAGHQALANISLLEMTDKIACVIDSATFKQNHYTPATHLPVVAPEILSEGTIQTVIIMGGSYSDEIFRIIKEKYPHIEAVILRDGGLENPS